MNLMDDEEFARWLNGVREQNDQINRLRGMETVSERLERLRREVDPNGTMRGAGQHRTWHDWRSPGLRNDCTLLDGHERGCRRVSESLENRPFPSSPDVDRWVIVVEAMVGAR